MTALNSSAAAQEVLEAVELVKEGRPLDSFEYDLSGYYSAHAEM